MAGEERAWTEKDTAEFDRLLEKAGRLPRMQLEAIQLFWKHRTMPMNPQEAVILNRGPLEGAYSDLRVLLSYRNNPNDPPAWRDSWHHPGAILGSGERVEDAVRRLVAKEVGAKVAWFCTVATANFPQLCREHELSPIHLVTLDGRPSPVKTNLSWFPLDDVPQNLLPHHKLMHERACEYIRFVRELREAEEHLLNRNESARLVEQFFHVTSVVESDTES